MDRIRIGFLCSFNAQKALIKEVARSMSDTVDVSVELGVMDEAIQPAKNLEAMGMEVLTAWDATAAIIEKHVSIPVMAIQISDLDLMRALNQAKQFGRNIALLYSEPLGGIELLEETPQRQDKTNPLQDGQRLQVRADERLQRRLRGRHREKLHYP